MTPKKQVKNMQKAEKMVGNNIMQRKDKLENVDSKFTPNLIRKISFT